LSHIHVVIYINIINQFLRHFTNKIHISSLKKTQDSAGLDYLKLLIILGYVKELNPNTFCKVREILFPSHIEQALQIDRKVLRKLLESEEQITSYNGNIQ